MEMIRNKRILIFLYNHNQCEIIEGIINSRKRFFHAYEYCLTISLFLFRTRCRYHGQRPNNRNHCQVIVPYRYGMTLVSNHFHSVNKRFLFSSAKPRDVDGMLGTELPVSMYTTKTPIDKWRFNVTQLKGFCGRL
jgi:hypothetical protein